MGGVPNSVLTPCEQEQLTAPPFILKNLIFIGTSANSAHQRGTNNSRGVCQQPPPPLKVG